MQINASRYMDDRCFHWSLFCNCMATGSCVPVRVSDVSWLDKVDECKSMRVDNWMTVLFPLKFVLQLASGSSWVHVRVSDVSWPMDECKSMRVDTWMTVFSIEVCFATGIWQQLCQCTVSVKIFFAVPSRMDAPWDTWFFLWNCWFWAIWNKMCSCQLCTCMIAIVNCRNPLLFSCRHGFDNTAGHAGYICASQVGIAFLICWKQILEQLWCHHIALFGIAFHVWNSFFVQFALESGLYKRPYNV